MRYFGAKASGLPIVVGFSPQNSQAFATTSYVILMSFL